MNPAPDYFDYPRRTEVTLVSRAALDAANALAWPGDDDAMVSIADEDDLKAVLEAAAPHIISAAVDEAKRETLADLVERTTRAELALMELRLHPAEMVRIGGKRDGVRLVRSYVEEALRMLGTGVEVIATPTPEPSDA